MKILIEFAPNAPMFVRQGWANVLLACGHTVYSWWPQQSPIFDMESKYGKFDLFICNTYSMDSALDKFIRRNPEMKVAMFCSAWGKLTDSIDSSVYPIVKVSEREKEALEKLKRETKKPDLVFIHIGEKLREDCIGGWSSIGIKNIGLMNAADTFTYLVANPQEKYTSDVSFVGGYWEYKARNINKSLVRFANENYHKLNIKIFGNGEWPLSQFLGGIDHGEDAKVFTSTKICPNISEPHSTTWGFDIIERCFKVPCANGFLISDYVQELLDEVFPNKECPTFSSYEEFQGLIYHYLDNEKERLDLQRRQKSVILASHTYFDRMQKLFSALTLPSEADKIMAEKQRRINDCSL